MTANDRSINNQFQAPGNSVATTTCQMPSSRLQPVLAIDQSVAANNLQLPSSNQLPAATDEVLSAASPVQPLTLITNPHLIMQSHQSTTFDTTFTNEFKSKENHNRFLAAISTSCTSQSQRMNNQG